MSFAPLGPERLCPAARRPFMTFLFKSLLEKGQNSLSRKIITNRATKFSFLGSEGYRQGFVPRRVTFEVTRGVRPSPHGPCEKDLVIGPGPSAAAAGTKFIVAYLSRPATYYFGSKTKPSL